MLSFKRFDKKQPPPQNSSSGPKIMKMPDGTFVEGFEPKGYTRYQQVNEKGRLERQDEREKKKLPVSILNRLRYTAKSKPESWITKLAENDKARAIRNPQTSFTQLLNDPTTTLDTLDGYDTQINEPDFLRQVNEVITNIGKVKTDEELKQITLILYMFRKRMDKSFRPYDKGAIILFEDFKNHVNHEKLKELVIMIKSDLSEESPTKRFEHLDKLLDILIPEIKRTYKMRNPENEPPRKSRYRGMV